MRSHRPFQGQYAIRRSPARTLARLTWCLLYLDCAKAWPCQIQSCLLPEFGLKSVELKPEEYDCVAVVTDHSSIDYEDVVAHAELVVDFRNATKAQAPREGKVWKL
jgi:UDP-N-acetyl-D-mannosaminuronate dehydrogenase